MAKTKKPQKTSFVRGPVSSDHPVYSSGYMLLRPIGKRKTESPSDDTTVKEEPSQRTGNAQNHPETTD